LRSTTETSVEGPKNRRGRRDRALIPDFLRETDAVCTQLAADFRGEYDGWEAGTTDAEAAALKRNK
jgi:hypothetical protein